jgi:hypothetical protein
MDRHDLPNCQELAARAQAPKALLRQYITAVDINRELPDQVMTRLTDRGRDRQRYRRDIGILRKHAAVQPNSINELDRRCCEG